MSSTSTDPRRRRRLSGGGDRVWVVDPESSSVEFTIRHLGVATVRGRFADFSGTIGLGTGDRAVHAEGSVVVSSITTGDAKRDEILRPARFFDADRFPTITYRSLSWRETGAGAPELHGELTIRGVTRPLALTVASGLDPAATATELVVEARGRLDRTRFGMPFDQEPSSSLLGRDVRLVLRLRAGG